MAMITDNIFESATRLGLTFSTSVGELIVTDIWQLPLQGSRCNLDALLVDLHSQLKKDEETITTFIPEKQQITTAPTADQLNKLRFDVVKHIFDVKLKEANDAKELQRKRTLKQDLLAIKAQREKDNLASKSDEDIDALIAGLDA